MPFKIRDPSLVTLKNGQTYSTIYDWKLKPYAWAVWDKDDPGTFEMGQASRRELAETYIERTEAKLRQGRALRRLDRQLLELPRTGGPKRGTS